MRLIMSKAAAHSRKGGKRTHEKVKTKTELSKPDTGEVIKLINHTLTKALDAEKLANSILDKLTWLSEINQDPETFTDPKPIITRDFAQMDIQALEAVLDTEILVKGNPGGACEFLGDRQIIANYPHLEQLTQSQANINQIARDFNLKPLSIFAALLYVRGFETIASELLDKHKDLFSRKDSEHLSNTLKRALTVDINPANLQVMQKLIVRQNATITDLYKASGDLSSPLAYLIAQDQNLPLLKWMVNSKKLDVRASYDFKEFSHYGKITLLMLSAYYEQIEVVKYLVEECKVDTTSVVYSITDAKHETPCNAISFAKTQIPIIQCLIDNGCPFLFTTVNAIFEIFTQDGISTYFQFINDLFNQDSFVTKSYNLLTKVFESTEAANWSIAQNGWKTIFDEYKKAKSEDTKETVPEVTTSLERIDEGASGTVARPEDSDEEPIININLLLQLYFEANNNFLKSEIAEQIINGLAISSWESIDLSGLHKFFSTQKKVIRELESVLAEKEHDPSSYTWHTPDGEEIHSTDSDVKEVRTSGAFHGRLFCAVSDTIKLLLGDKLTHGLEHLKVLTRGSKGENGIKFLPQTEMITLKTRELGDDRPYTNGLFESDKKTGAFLVYFDELTTHRGGLDLETIGEHHHIDYV